MGGSIAASWVLVGTVVLGIGSMWLVDHERDKGNHLEVVSEMALLDPSEDFVKEECIILNATWVGDRESKKCVGCCTCNPKDKRFETSCHDVFVYYFNATTSSRDDENNDNRSTTSWKTYRSGDFEHFREHDRCYRDSWCIIDGINYCLLDTIEELPYKAGMSVDCWRPSNNLETNMSYYDDIYNCGNDECVKIESPQTSFDLADVPQYTKWMLPVGIVMVIVGIWCYCVAFFGEAAFGLSKA